MSRRGFLYEDLGITECSGDGIVWSARPQCEHDRDEQVVQNQLGFARLGRDGQSNMFEGRQP
jgi:hypothetical protein